MISPRIRILARLALALALAAGPSPGAAAQPRGYVLGPDDLIQVEVFGQADFITKTRIKPDGSIALPLIGSVRAEGDTVVDLAREVTGRLTGGGYFRAPVVDVQVIEYVSRAVTVLGAVGLPGLIPLDRPLTVSTALAKAGGVRPGGADYVLLRAKGQPERRLSVGGLAGATDPALGPGDQVFVPEADLFYVYGQVTTPGGYPMREGMTLRQALARGGGPTLTGNERRTLLYRAGKPAADADLDQPLRAGDVLFVKERVF